MLARMAMIAITTSSSIRVKAEDPLLSTRRKGKQFKDRTVVGFLVIDGMLSSFRTFVKNEQAALQRFSEDPGNAKSPGER